MLRALLAHVYWLGGASGAGKSTVARRLAVRHGLQWYATDTTMAAHARRIGRNNAPYLNEFQAMSMDDRWVNRSPEVMLETFHWFRGEGFSLIIEDLLHLPAEPGIVADGFRLLPHLVKPLLSTPHQAAWLLPTPEFRRAAFTSRGTLWEIARRTGDPPRALHNLLERDRMFTNRLRREASQLGLPVFEISTTTTESALTSQLAELFRL